MNSTAKDLSLLLTQGDAARRRHQFADADSAYQKALAIAEKDAPAGEMFGQEHLPIAEVLVKLGRLAETRGDTKASENYYRKALDIFSHAVGDEYFDLAIARDHIGVPTPSAGKAA